MSEPTQEQVSEMVKVHVYTSANQLVSELFENYMEQLSAIIFRPDYQTTAEDAGFTVHKNDDGMYAVKTDGIDAHGQIYEAEDIAWREICHDNNLDVLEDEAYEHWIVSNWLANHLEKRGEMVDFDFLGLTIWGRCTTGQAIHLDDVMVEICANSHYFK